ncbi:MAG TPA: aspartate carbamoyltransferase, partial [Candidatus Faecousia intestinigallinarum]|nr:aspartate carbamoyltransferase [Candidatus Faecousia intestinigallinarum]
QRERFDSPQAYERLKDSYVLTLDKLRNAKPTMRVLHPLPRVNEISVQVDSDPRAAYFRQALNGKLMRMALILKLLEDAEEGRQMPAEQDVLVGELVCDNPRCISATEQELPHAFRCVDRENGVYRCIYCEGKKMRKP